MPTENAHSDLGPSGADRWIACPGSVLATAGMPDVETAYSKAGTLQHALAADAAERGVTAATAAAGAFETDEVEAVQVFLDYCRELPGETLTEIRVGYERVIPGGFGTMDKAKITSDVWHVVDAKFGQGVAVYAERNPQLMLYAFGLMEEFGWLFPLPEKIVLHICQPHLDHIDVWETTVVEVADWVAAVAVPAAERALQPDAPFKAGDWCQFCPLKATCRVRARHVMDALGIQNLDTVPGVARPPIELSELEISNALHALAQIRSWCKALEAYAMAKAQQSQPLGGWYLSEGRSNRAWNAVDGDVAMRVMKIAQDIAPEDLWTDPTIISPAQMETKLGKKRFKLVADLVHKPPGKPKLTPPGSKAPPIAAGILDGITDLDGGGDE